MSPLTNLEYRILCQIPPEGIYFDELKSAVARNAGIIITNADMSPLGTDSRGFVVGTFNLQIHSWNDADFIFYKITPKGIAAREAMATETVKKNTDA